MPTWDPATIYELQRDKANLFKEAIDGMENKTLKVGDYVDWPAKYALNSIFTDNLSDLQAILAVYNKTLVNPSGSLYKLANL